MRFEAMERVCKVQNKTLPQNKEIELKINITRSFGTGLSLLYRLNKSLFNRLLSNTQTI